MIEKCKICKREFEKNDKPIRGRSSKGRPVNCVCCSQECTKINNLRLTSGDKMAEDRQTTLDEFK